MKRNLATLAWACAAFFASILLAMVLTYAVWYLRSWDYIHSPPRSPGDPHDAAAYVLLAEELIFGLPAGAVLGIFAVFVVLSRRHGRRVHSRVIDQPQPPGGAPGGR